MKTTTEQQPKDMIISWERTPSDRKNSADVVGMSHPGCCKQSGGCGRKHGGK